MPIEITGAHPPEHRFKPGEVIMVRRTLLDKKTKKPFDWRYFAIALRVGRSQALQVCILDGREDREPFLLFAQSNHDQTVWFLPEAEWPDGVHAFRTKLILEGRIEGIDELF